MIRDDFTLAVPAGRDAFLEAHLRHFPGEAQGLRRLLELSGRMYDEFVRFPTDPGIAGIIRAPLRFPALFRYRNATLAQVIDAQLSDPRLKAVYATLWPWVGSPPSKASFVMWGILMGSFVGDGPYYYRGRKERMVATVTRCRVARSSPAGPALAIPRPRPRVTRG